MFQHQLLEKREKRQFEMVDKGYEFLSCIFHINATSYDYVLVETLHLNPFMVMNGFKDEGENKKIAKELVDKGYLLTSNSSGLNRYKINYDEPYNYGYDFTWDVLQLPYNVKISDDAVSMAILRELFNYRYDGYSIDYENFANKHYLQYWFVKKAVDKLVKRGVITLTDLDFELIPKYDELRLAYHAAVDTLLANHNLKRKFLFDPVNNF